MSRLTKLDRMSNERRAAEAIRFWAAPSEATFSTEVLAVVFSKSLPWFQLKRCAGGGIPYYKQGRTILYKKQDALDFFSARKLNNTSEETANL